MNDETDVSGMIDYAWNHAIISDQLHQNIYKECDLTKENQTVSCSSYFKGFMQAYSDIDIYSIYTPVCPSSLSTPPKLVVSPRLFTPHVSFYVVFILFLFIKNNIFMEKS